MLAAAAELFGPSQLRLWARTLRTRAGASKLFACFPPSACAIAFVHQVVQAAQGIYLQIDMPNTSQRVQLEGMLAHHKGTECKVHEHTCS